VGSIPPDDYSEPSWLRRSQGKGCGTACAFVQTRHVHVQYEAQVVIEYVYNFGFGKLLHYRLDAPRLLHRQTAREGSELIAGTTTRSKKTAFLSNSRVSFVLGKVWIVEPMGRGFR
jgi:hypothetical protein